MPDAPSILRQRRHDGHSLLNGLTEGRHWKQLTYARTHRDRRVSYLFAVAPHFQASGASKNAATLGLSLGSKQPSQSII